MLPRVPGDPDLLFWSFCRARRVHEPNASWAGAGAFRTRFCGLRGHVERARAPERVAPSLPVRPDRAGRDDVGALTARAHQRCCQAATRHAPLRSRPATQLRWLLAWVAEPSRRNRYINRHASSARQQAVDRERQAIGRLWPVRAPWSALRACLHARDGAGGRGRTQRCDRRSAAVRLCHYAIWVFAAPGLSTPQGPNPYVRTERCGRCAGCGMAFVYRPISRPMHISDLTSLVSRPPYKLYLVGS